MKDRSNSGIEKFSYDSRKVSLNTLLQQPANQQTCCNRIIWNIRDSVLLCWKATMQSRKMFGNKGVGGRSYHLAIGTLMPWTTGC
ncbi:hypothetical protein Y032_0087g2095 [Ancylostoma ceylanicum]|uniref:Uncharacterized protein n=1 Tax=Ancylostoma ceylanicum TaxID=53326 RepID=A0A016TPP6_9BILA|nr:hypothetical protein Y032_0087g2095 [Ancylostoma ceylanicum]